MGTSQEALSRIREWIVSPRQELVAGIRENAHLSRMGVEKDVMTAMSTRIVNSCRSMKPLERATLAITNSIIPRPFMPNPAAQLSGLVRLANVEA